jgi:hypothetical protein
MAIGYLNAKYVLLHAAVVAIHGQALLFPGCSRAGKSTLAAGLVLSGYSYLSDEVAVIDGARLRVWPFPKPISIRYQAVDVLAREYPRWQETFCQDFIVKSAEGLLVGPRALRLPETASDFPIKYVVFPEHQAERVESELVQLSRGQALIRVLRQRFDHSNGADFARFSAVMIRLLRQAECYSLLIGSLRSAVACIDRLLGDARRESSFVHTDRVPVPVHEPLRAP